MDGILREGIMSFGNWAWAICGRANEAGEVREKVLAIPGVLTQGPGTTPVFNGSLNDWIEHWDGEFTVHPQGAYITV